MIATILAAWLRVRSLNGRKHGNGPGGQGGLVENLSYENITMKNVKSPIVITSYYHGLPKPGVKDEAKPVDEKTPIWKEIRISNLVASGSGDAGLVMGLPEMPIQHLTLENVTISAEKQMRIGNAKGVIFKNVKIDVKQGEPMLIEDGVEVRHGVHPVLKGVRTFYVDDPDGNEVEVIGPESA